MARNHAVPRVFLFVQTEIRTRVFGEHVVFDERIRIQKQRNALPRRQFPLKIGFFGIKGTNRDFIFRL